MDGNQPSGPDEDDPRVVAVRRYDILVKASNNELNFTDPRLAQVATSEWIDVKAHRARRDIESGRFSLWEGPNDMTLVAIDHDGDEVIMCSRLPTRWTWDDDESAVAEKSRDSGEFEYDTYELVQQDGRWLVESFRADYGPGDGPCDPGPNVAFGAFTTQPDLGVLGTLSPDDVVARSER
ncbi:hypothetical protein [Xylanimonas ulmi]|uniref:hypothetical protein n=1 Tax=Xylanimonas ulmi TaxID=228973 RepID=UPI00102B5665|nr:hypothetical protein [Xylanibacterium ulmi]